MQFLLIYAIKPLLKIVLMQAKLEQIELTLSELEKHLNELDINESSSRIQQLTTSLESIFDSEDPFTEQQKEVLTSINSRLIKLCKDTAEKKEQTKQELSTLVKNKKKVGIYNQLK